jgi:retron-type reverse transcriptase
VNDTKRREIVVASIKDRFVHRLLYEHLVGIYDKTFIFDVWSCREGKGLLAALERTQDFLASSRSGYFWRGDVRKFFDSVDHSTLLRILGRRIDDDVTMGLLKKVIDSYAINLHSGVQRERERERERVLSNVHAESLSAM